MDNDTCVRYNSYIIKNDTFFKISTKYEGIPQNFAINIGSYIILIGLFIFLRKKAWNYGKLSWINKPVDLVAASMQRETHVEEEGDTEYCYEEKPLIGKNTNSFIEKIWRIIPIFIKMSDEQLSKKCGPDAVVYCQFQRNLITTVAVMMCFSLIVIVPVNLYSGKLKISSDFSTLTIGNIEANNQILWVHFSVAFLLMLFAFFLSNRFLRHIDMKTKDEMNSSIMIKNIPLNWCDELSIQKHFLEAFPTVKVRRVQVTYKVDKLIDIYTEKIFAEEALEFCYDELEKNGERVMVVPHVCGRVISCQCCVSEKCTPVDGIEYYSAEVIRLSNLFVVEKKSAKENYILPIIFVTFENVKQALLVRRDYIYQNYCCINKQPCHTSSLSKDMKSSEWNVAFAPMAQDILWQNLHKRGWKWWIPVVLANFLVAVVVIVLSTPAVILNLITQYQITQKLNDLKNPFIAQVIPSLILVLVNSLMPVLIYWSDQLSGHWTKTSQTMSVMNKLYAVLVTTVLILPSLGLNSIRSLFDWLFPMRNNNTSIYPSSFRWECIFMADGGALFCNYLISASFIGTALELLRFGELFLFSCKRCFSKSRAEDKAISKKILWEFQYGLGYAWTLALFTMISAYAVIVPIITPFGLAYLILKHLVDRYNMINVNIPSTIHNSVHTNAAQLMQIGLVLTQATVTIYVSLRIGNNYVLPTFCYIAFVIGLLLTFGRTTKRWIMSMSCIKYSLRPPQQGESLGVAPCTDLVIEDDGFILMDDFRNNVFIPPQMEIEEPANIDDILRRKSVAADLPSQLDS